MDRAGTSPCLWDSLTPRSLSRLLAPPAAHSTQVEGWSNRALVNWGRAMCIRAELSASQPEVVQKLYRAALDKFEAVLEEEPGALRLR